MSEVKKKVFQCIIRYLNGDMDQFKNLVNQAMNEYDREKHLYVSIGDIVNHKKGA